MMKNIFNIMSAASFAGVLFMISMLAYVNITKAGREEMNRQYIQSVVDKAVLEQIVERRGINSISKVLLRRQC